MFFFLLLKFPREPRQKNDGLNFFLKVNVLYNLDSLGHKKQMLKVV